MKYPTATSRLFLASAAAAALLGTATTARAATVLTTLPVGPITFEGANDYAHNFRERYDAGGRLGQTSNASPANNYLAQASVTSTPADQTDNGITIYDTTPGDGAATQHVFSGPFSVTFQARAAQGASSIGVFFFDPTNGDNNLLALVNIDASGTNDTIRFWRDAVLSNSITSPGTQVGSTLTAQSGIDAGSAFSTLTVDYSVSGTTPTIKVTFGSLTATSAYAAGDAIATPELGLRLYDASTAAGTTDVDNFAVVSVPEPGTVGLLGLFVAPALLRRRHPRR